MIWRNENPYTTEDRRLKPKEATSPSMPETLKQILETRALDRVELYRKGKIHLRVFVAGQEEFAWDGRATDQALKLIDHAFDAAYPQEATKVI